MSVLLVAVKPLLYEGRTVGVGEVFAVRRPVEALALTYQQKAKYAPKNAKPTLSRKDVLPESDEPTDKPTRRRYQRRDLTAEP